MSVSVEMEASFMVQLLSLRALAYIETGFRSIKTSQVLIQCISFYVESFICFSRVNITSSAVLLNAVSLYLDVKKHSNKKDFLFFNNLYIFSM